MKVRLIRDYGDRYGCEHKQGDVVEFVEHIAAKLVRHGIAVPGIEHVAVAEVKESPAPEAAVVTPRERAVKPKPRARKA